MQVMLELSGATPLVMHNVRLSDPSDPIVRQIKEITDKDSKHRTDADTAELERLEWFGGLYHEPTTGVYAPSSWIVRSFNEAGKATKDGRKILRGIAMLSDKLPLVYEGPKDLDALYRQPEHVFRASVRVGMKRVWRVRPIFRRWSLSFELEMAEDILNLSDLVTISERAGRSEGLGDARVLGYGRFNAEVVSDPTTRERMNGQTQRAVSAARG